MDNRTILSSPEWEDQLARLVEQYESQWRKLIEKIAPPDPSSFVSSIELPAGSSPDLSLQIREELWKALVSIDADYRRRLLKQASSLTNKGDLGNPMISANDQAADASLKETGSIDQADIRPGFVDAHGATVSYAPGSEDVGVEIKPADPSVESDPNVENPTQVWDGTDPEPDSSMKPTAAQSPRLPDIPGYKIERILGQGGMGVVYRAEQVGLNRAVALKMILDKRQSDDSMLARFQSEAEAVAKLDHENIVKIYDIGTHNGLPYFSLEYIDGGSLEDEWDFQPMEPGRCAEVLVTLAEAMDRAHAAGLVHRDLKPANVLIRNDGTLKVTDFGLVKQIEDDSGQTQEGTVMGTPSYMAPEQAWGQTDVGPLADVYSLGAILYALLTGRPPFQGPNAVETIVQLRENEPILPSRLQPKIPRDLETICLKAIRKAPSERYSTAQELADDLKRYQKGEPIQARSVGAAVRAWKWCRRNPVPAIALALFLCLAVGGPAAALAINTQRVKAIEAQELAEANEELANENAVIAGKQRDLAKKNEINAGEQRNLALNTLGVIVERVGTDLRAVPGAEPFRRRFLDITSTGLTKIADAEDESDRDIVYAKMHAKMGEGLFDLGETKAAHEQFLKSHAKSVALAARKNAKTRRTDLLRLGRSFRNLGDSAKRLEGNQAAEAYYKQSLEVRREALKGAENSLFVKQEVAEALGRLGEVELAQGRSEGLNHITEGLTYRKEKVDQTPKDAKAWLELAGATFNLGHSCNDFGKHEEALGHFQAAISYLKPLRDGGSLAGRANAALGHVYLGRTYQYLNKLEMSREEYKTGVADLEQLSKEAPRQAWFKRKLSQALYGRASVEDDPRQAQELFQRCFLIRDGLAEGDRADLMFQQTLMFPLARLGRATEAAAIADRLRREIPDDAGNLYVVAACYALCAEARKQAPAVAESPNRPSPRTGADFEKLAIQTLSDAVKKGYKKGQLMRVDPDLAPIRALQEFQALLETL